MSFVKLDTGLIDSSLWLDPDATRVFIAALCKAVPHEITEPTPTLAVRNLDDGGFTVPPGWYGLVAAASTGLIAKAQPLDLEVGLAALERLASPDQFSRSPEHEGRRLVRISGGFLMLNYVPYRDRDHSSAERSRRYRDRKRGDTADDLPTVTPSRHVTPCRVTHADAECRSQSADGDAGSEGSGEAPSKPVASESDPILTHPTAIDPPRRRDRKPKGNLPAGGDAQAQYLFDEINAGRVHIFRRKMSGTAPTPAQLKSFAYLCSQIGEVPSDDQISHVVDVRAAMDSRGESWGELSWDHLCRPASWQRYRDREVGKWGRVREQAAE